MTRRKWISGFLSPMIQYTRIDSAECNGVCGDKTFEEHSLFGFSERIDGVKLFIEPCLFYDVTMTRSWSTNRCFDRVFIQVCKQRQQYNQREHWADEHQCFTTGCGLSSCKKNTRSEYDIEGTDPSGRFGCPVTDGAPQAVFRTRSELGIKKPHRAKQKSVDEDWYF